MFTYQDATDHLVDFVGGGLSDALARDCRRAVLEAYREIATAHRWPYYYRNATIAATPGTSVYSLPDDFVAQGASFRAEGVGYAMEYVSPGAWGEASYNQASTAIRYGYSIFGHPDLPGKLALHLSPDLDIAFDVKLNYMRRPRPLKHPYFSSGLATVVPDGLLYATMTTTAPAFDADMVGSVVRVSRNAKVPTSDIGGQGGYNPAAAEYIIATVESTTEAFLSGPMVGHAGVGYSISDPIDIEEGAMLTAFLRRAEMGIAQARKLKDKPNVIADYMAALAFAKAAASPSFAPRVAGVGNYYPVRLRDRGPIPPGIV